MPRKAIDPVSKYERMKRDAAARNAAASLSGRDIGKLPKVKNPRRKKKCKDDLLAFCQNYFKAAFYLSFSPDQKKCISKIEDTVKQGGRFAFAMPRGSGKSTILKIGCIWALFYGHRSFVALIQASETMAASALNDIKMAIQTNDELIADFPEVCYPILKLDGIANRCAGQLYHGERTLITWTANEIILPTIKGSPASGAIIRVAGITGAMRGMSYMRPDGRIVRPELIIVDDPQTRESAASPGQNNTRLKILSSDILGLAGPGVALAAFMACTVIYPGDMADRILDRKEYPQWNGERAKMIYEFPTNKDLWDKYENIWRENPEEATRFYKENQSVMDEGAVVAWPERFNEGEISGIQHAMNKKIDDEAAFMSECQNEPMEEIDDAIEQPEPDIIYNRINRIPRRQVPKECSVVTAMIDVHDNLLYYLVAAWTEDFTGFVLDYGCYPKQKRKIYTLRDARPTMKDVYPSQGQEGRVYSALTDLTTEILDREYVRKDGSTLKVATCLIDASWGETTDVVYQFCRQSKHSHILYPAHGRFFGAASKPIGEGKRRPGDRVGNNWIIPASQGKHDFRHVTYDSNFWKSFFMKRLLTAVGDKGSLTLFGSEERKHELLAAHWCSEFRTPTEGASRRVDVWQHRPNGGDNHLFDCMVGNCVAASMNGAAAEGTAAVKQKSKGVPLNQAQRRRIVLGGH